MFCREVLVALCSILFVVSTASAQTIDKPSLKAGDAWTYRTVIEQTANQSAGKQAQWTEKHYDVTIVRTGLKSMLVSRKEKGSNQPAIEVATGPDWSRYRSVNGEDTVVSQPLNFPLTEGKTWNLLVVESRPNNQYKSAETQLTYVVAGWEEISVPAGKFKAVKIEAEGRWKSEREPSSGSLTASRTDRDGTTTLTQSRKMSSPNIGTGRLYSAYWYLPEAKVYIKSVEEQFYTNGTLSRRTTEELEGMKVQ